MADRPTRRDLPNPTTDPPPPRKRTLSESDLDAIEGRLADATGGFRVISSTPPPIRKLQKLLWKIVVEHWPIKLTAGALGALAKFLHELWTRGWPHP